MEMQYGLSGTDEEKTMSEQIENIYSDISNILYTHEKINLLSMCATQSLGYNGFKRWHRCRSKQFFNLIIELYSELFDKFKIKIKLPESDVSYNQSSIEKHLKSWDSLILGSIKKLGTIDKKYYELTGTRNYVIEDAMKIFMKDYKKVEQYIKRFTESDWLTLDMHIIDDKLYDKFKKKEEEYDRED